MLSVIMLSVIKLSVVMLSVVAPLHRVKESRSFGLLYNEILVVGSNGLLHASKASYFQFHQRTQKQENMYRFGCALTSVRTTLSINTIGNDIYIFKLHIATKCLRTFILNLIRVERRLV